MYHTLGAYYVQNPDEPIAVRYIPFALFVPNNNLVFEKLWEICQKRIFKLLVEYLPSDHSYRTEPVEQKSIMASIEDTIIILGNYKEPFKSELASVRDYLRDIGYDVFLIEELPETSEQSLSDKVRLWTTASRFCIMIDREASGHIKEYEMVKDQRKPLVLLRPKESGSTWMIGDDELVDLNYINTFEFQDSPLETLDDSVKWAENLLAKRGESYPKFYPWKTDENNR